MMRGTVFTIQIHLNRKSWRHACVASVASVANTYMFPSLKVTCSLNKIRSLGKQGWNDSKSSWTSKQDPCQPQSSLRSKIPQNISQNLPWNPKTVGILFRFNSRLQVKKPYSHTVYSTYPEFTYERFGAEKILRQSSWTDYSPLSQPLGP